MLEKNKRWVEKDYTRWEATLPCVNCGLHDETIVAHHLKHRWAPYGLSRHDWLTMPLCYICHDKAHNGDANILDWQHMHVFNTLQLAYNRGIMKYEKRKLFGEDLDD